MGDIGKVWETVIAVLLAVTGGLARLLNAKGGKKLRWGRILSELFISGFAGLMVLMFARASGLSGDWVGVVCGMSGWVGPRMLDLIVKVTGKATGLSVEDNKNKNNNDDENERE